jgi:hypothetical protein
MKRTHLIFITVTMAMLVTFEVRAGVQVSSVEPTEKVVALLSPDKRYVTASPPSSLDLSGVKIGSKQTFTIIDLNGEELADGDEVQIRYTPNSGGKPDPSKSSYWREVKEGVKRGKDGDMFKVKRVDTKYAFQAPSGKFVGGTSSEGLLAVTEKQEGALLVELVDLSQGIPKKPKKSATGAPAAPAPEKPDTD